MAFEPYLSETKRVDETEANKGVLGSVTLRRRREPRKDWDVGDGPYEGGGRCTSLERDKRSKVEHLTSVEEIGETLVREESEKKPRECHARC